MSGWSREDEWTTLMRAAIEGDAVAYRRFLVSVTPYVRTVAQKRCRVYGAPDNEAEDVVQEVLLALHLKRQSWDISRPVGPWLAAIVRNKMIDALRRRGRRNDVPIDDFAETLATEEPEDGLRAHEIDVLLGQLRPQQREIVAAISLEGKTIQETAGRLHMNEGAVRVALHRALKTLAGLYRSSHS